MPRCGAGRKPSAGGAVVDILGWQDKLDAVVCTEDVPQGRPAPYMIFRAMEATGVTNVAQVLTAGDATRDLESGTNAGAAGRSCSAAGCLLPVRFDVGPLQWLQADYAGRPILGVFLACLSLCGE
jgi:phosphoglycolate phosphatase-like HAD superfamily hydrolase